MNASEEKELYELVNGIRQPKNGMEKHFLQVLAGKSIACSQQEKEWAIWVKLNQKPPENKQPPKTKPPPSKLPMTGHKSIYLECQDCNFDESAFLLLKRAGLLLKKGNPSLEYVQTCLSKIKCSRCNSNNLKPFTKDDKVGGSYVATANSGGRVFHKSKCGWLIHVPLHSTILFTSREEAIRLGYRPCNSCRP